MVIVLTIIHVLVCFFLVVVVLLQSGKAADLAGAFGGMGSQTAFGPRGAATVLSKATTVAAALFMVTSLSLAILATRNAGSSGSRTVLDRAKTPAKPPVTPTPAPVQPGAPMQMPVRVGEGPVKPGQPSVTLSDESGASKTLPIKIPPAPKPARQQPPGQQQQQKQAPVPAKK